LIFAVSFRNDGGSAITPTNAYAADDHWYVGEGAEQNTYVTYLIKDHDTNNGAPFTMTIYFEKQNNDGDWVAPSFVVDSERVLNGTLLLSSLDMSILGKGSKIPSEMVPYVDGYKDSLQWLSAYVPRPGKSLGAASWGKIASIGGSEIKPDGSERLTVQGGAFDTVKIIYHKSIDNTIWVSDGFPFPIKAETYADVTTGRPPVQYSFELQATGTGKPVAPPSAIEIPEPPLEQLTGRGTYYIDLNWSPSQIRPGSSVTFDLSFFDDRHNPVQNVGYDLKVTDYKGYVVADLKNQFASESVGRHIIDFPDGKAGPAKVDVKIVAVGSKDPGDFIESVTFNIVAVPEFQVNILLLLLIAGSLGTIIVILRAKGAGIGQIHRILGS
jgi:hypothetical protein